MTKLEGIPFKNSDTCKGVTYMAQGVDFDMAKIEINGRYPETGWAMNRESDEMVVVIKGVGQVALVSSGEVAIASGDVVHIPAGEWFAWKGEMTLAMSCHPAFKPEQYDIIEINASDEILMRAHQVTDKYFPEDKLFTQVEGMDKESILNFLYGQLLETGEDPDEVMKEFGIIEDK